MYSVSKEYKHNIVDYRLSLALSSLLSSFEMKGSCVLANLIIQLKALHCGICDLTSFGQVMRLKNPIGSLGMRHSTKNKRELIKVRTNNETHTVRLL